jgi:2''-5'' RNA ligase
MLFRPSRPVVHSLFFAIFPDAEAAAKISALAHDLRLQHGLRGMPYAPRRLHVTLFHVLTLPELPPGVLAAAKEAASAVTMRPFTICLDRVMSFDNGALVLCADDGVAGVEKLQDEVQRSVGKLFPSLKARPGVPHLTMLRDRQLVAPQAVEPISWLVRDFELIDSHQGLTYYRREGRWPLREADSAWRDRGLDRRSEGIL